MKWRWHREKIEEIMNHTFSVGHVKLEMLTRHPYGDVQETVEYAGMTFKRGYNLETKTLESSAYNWYFKAS